MVNSGMEFDTVDRTVCNGKIEYISIYIIRAMICDCDELRQQDVRRRWIDPVDEVMYICINGMDRLHRDGFETAIYVSARWPRWTHVSHCKFAYCAFSISQYIVMALEEFTGLLFNSPVIS